MSVCEGYRRFREVDRHIFIVVGDYILGGDDVSLYNISIGLR